MEQHKWAPPPIRNQHDMHNKPIWISRVCTCHTAGLQHQSSDLQEASEAFACNWKRQVKKMSRLKNGTTLIKISISAEVRKTQARQNSSWGDSKLLFWIRNGSLICQGREFFSKRFLSQNKLDVSRICELEKEQSGYLSLPDLMNSFENYWETFTHSAFIAVINLLSFLKPGITLWEFHTLGGFYSSCKHLYFPPWWIDDSCRNWNTLKQLRHIQHNILLLLCCHWYDYVFFLCSRATFS